MDLVSLILSEPSFSSSAGTSGLEEGSWDFESEKKKRVLVSFPLITCSVSFRNYFSSTLNVM